jgi:hypothetical protein
MKMFDALPNPRMTMSQNENGEKTDIPKAQTQPKEGKRAEQAPPFDHSLRAL